MTVLDHMLDELEKIGNATMGYGGMSSASSSMPSPPSMSNAPRMSTPTPSMPPNPMGATAMAGMSTHCDRCFCKLPEHNVPKKCPRCGCPIKAVRDIESAPSEKQDNAKEPGETRESGETGGEAAVNEELSEGAYADMGKYSSAGMHPLLITLKESIVPVTAIGGGLWAGLKLRSFGQRASNRRSQQEYGAYAGPHYKQAGVRHSKGSRLVTLNLHRRAGNYGSVQAALDRIDRVAAKHAKRIASVV